MADNLYVMEAANLFCGDTADVTVQGKYLSLSELRLPVMEENFVSHLAGGSGMEVEVNTHLAKIDAAFNIAGWQPDVLTMIGSSNAAKQRFTAYGAIRDKRAGVLVRATAVIWGRLARAAPQAWRRGDLQHFEFTLRGIDHYELYMGAANDRIYYWDFFDNVYWAGNEDIFGPTNDVLYIPGTVAPAGGSGTFGA